MLETGEAVGMSEKQITAGREAWGESVDQFRACGLVEIDHHVAAKDHVERLSMVERLNQIQAVELDHVADGRFDAIPAFPAVRTAQQVFPEALRREIAKPTGGQSDPARRLYEARGGVDGPDN